MRRLLAFASLLMGCAGPRPGAAPDHPPVSANSSGVAPVDATEAPTDPAERRDEQVASPAASSLAAPGARSVEATRDAVVAQLRDVQLVLAEAPRSRGGTAALVSNGSLYLVRLGGAGGEPLSLNRPWRSPPEAEVRLADVDGDGEPDVVYRENAVPGRRRPTAEAFLSGDARGGEIQPDPGRTPWLLDARTIDEAVTAAAAVPRQGINETTLRALLSAPARAAAPTLRLLHWTSEGLVPRDDPAPTPLGLPGGHTGMSLGVNCARDRPVCRHWLFSGDTHIPCSDRYFWFVWIDGKPRVFAFADDDRC